MEDFLNILGQSDHSYTVQFRLKRIFRKGCLKVLKNQKVRGKRTNAVGYVIFGISNCLQRAL